MTVPPVGGDRRRALGTSGEDRAAAWYEEHGYEVVDRNWRGRAGEIDLVARRGGTLVFSEVKTRSGRSFGEPFEAVTAAKQSRLRKLAAEWLRSRRASLPPAALDIRFDVVSVIGGRVDVLEEAF
ncbi:MAG TPA: YraN family protein [Acidimicrobiales bacterium]|nr:YraN family protein [Acidimicrobiales bacterium]